MNSTETVRENFLEAQRILSEFISADETFKKIQQAGDLLLNAFRSGNKVISCGNGGSMCDAMHFAEELSGRFRENRKALPAVSISDPEALGNNGDVLLAISTSGNSKNILNAINVAKEKGMKVIGLTGKDGGAMAGQCDVEIRAPHSKYADRAQEIHIKVIHSLIHYVELELKD
jgi:D-sedoheptulose 7-phosphate isomerase